MTKRPPGVNIALRRSRLSEQGNDALKYIKASQGEELEQGMGAEGKALGDRAGGPQDLGCTKATMVVQILLS